MGQQDFHTHYTIFEEYLQAHQPYGSPDSLYKPIRYINDLGGKRIRPVLVLLAYRLFDQDTTPALPAAMAIEYFHQFSLMHDDIMDESPLRRGKEAVHEKYGRNAAILSGDAMLIRSFDLLLQAGERTENGAFIASLMCRTALDICEGQQMDMDFEERSSPTEIEYLEMIRKKTACLLGLSLQIGAVLAGSTKDEAQALYHFGECIGLGFQIQDDYLDTFGDSASTGKIQGGDILRGKKNFLFVRTCGVLSPVDQTDFIKLYAQAAVDQSIQPVLDFYVKHHIDQYALQMQSTYFEKAESLLADWSEEKRAVMVGLKEMLVHRIV